MFVWIPRYAYKITSGYHTANTGTIEIAFLDTNNNFLNGETGELVEEPSQVTYTNNVQNQWLVHPAFTSKAENGGGFGELEGMWVGKFEATGTKEKLTVKPGVPSLQQGESVNEFFKLAQKSNFEEKENLKSHMAKHSEWGMTAYLAHSKYGVNGKKVEKNVDGNYCTGGSNIKTKIYTSNKLQSTTANATGVYDMNGGTWEFVAAYTNIKNNSSLLKNGGTQKGDLYGTEEERNTNTEYKMVYEGTGEQVADYEKAKKYKGDGIYETSAKANSSTSWFSAGSIFTNSSYPLLVRSGENNSMVTGLFYFGNTSGSSTRISFRIILAL